ncbi:hypothetical protein [Acinetobacter equi]|uniref:Uncharacterized protein n=1 Tax=Acinetobacter equi TaxID=1324350 RepID=A0A0N9VZ89_9GAMM|nr:hypothetical protein [Acinetobacter equi]ALH95482.1 hypothetical protein AOY20_08040 [Acinetobacter equi]
MSCEYILKFHNTDDIFIFKSRLERLDSYVIESDTISVKLKSLLSNHNWDHDAIFFFDKTALNSVDLQLSNDNTYIYNDVKSCLLGIIFNIKDEDGICYSLEDIFNIK